MIPSTWLVPICFILFSHCIFTFAANQNGECSRYNFHPKPKEIFPNNTYGLWPGLANKIDLENGETVIGFEEVRFVCFFNLLWIYWGIGN